MRVNFRVMSVDDSFEAVAINEYGREIIFKADLDTTIGDILDGIQESKTIVEIENEKLEKEKAEAIEKIDAANSAATKAKKALNALASKYVDGDVTPILWEDAVKDSQLLKVGDLVSYDGTIYTVIFEHTASIDRPPYGTWLLFTDISKEVNEEVAGEGGVPEIVGPDTLHLYPQGCIGQKNGTVYKSKWPNNGNPVTDTGWWDNLGPVDKSWKYLEDCL